MIKISGARMRIMKLLTVALIIGVAPAARADDLMVMVVSVTRPVHPGGTVTLVIQTRPGAICVGTRQGHYGNAYTVPLASIAAGADGRAQWQWKVLNGNHPIGLRGVHVTCTADDQRGAVDAQFDVE